MKPAARNIVRNALDQQIPVMKQTRSAVRRPVKGWLRAVRDAIGLSRTEVARKMGISRQAYTELETAEGTHSITLKSLERAAQAIDCEVVYFLTPRIDETFAELARRHDPLFRQLQKTEHSMALEAQAVGDLPAKRKSQ